MRAPLLAALLLFASSASLLAQDGNALVHRYLAIETAKLQNAPLDEIKSLDDWNARKDEYRRQMYDMLGLDPLPPRTDLKATTTGRIEHDEFVVEKVHFQSRPQLYVTGNLYLPKQREGKIPAILYVCGHGGVKKNGISYGNKVHYQHHGAWFARHGYACLTIDSLQLGEIEALHHGLHREGMWWWPSRGYTPAGVEAWNCIRALDYLQSREEIDGERLGVTGRSGGGAYSWWIAALDERIKAAVPVAGITDLQNHVVDGVIEGHCDCMFMNNTYQWDYPMVAALVAPRPLVISNTDSDTIFPLDGVYRTFVAARRIYTLHKAGDKIAFNITAGGHKDTQELQMQAFRWFDQHLMKTDRTIEKAAVKFFEPEQLRVFDELPQDQINTKIQEQFVAAAPAPEVPADAASWNAQRDAWKKQLQEKVFRGWPADAPALDVKQVATDRRDNLVLARYAFSSQEPYRLDLFILHKEGLKKPELVVLNVLDEQGWNELLATAGSKFDAAFRDVKLPPADEEKFHALEQTLINHDWVFAYVAPRGIGPTAWTGTPAKLTHLRRRFILLGQTHEGQEAWDARRAMQAIREIPSLRDAPLWLQAERQSAGIALAASLFEPNITRLDLHHLPTSLREGPHFMNAERYVTMPALVALAAECSRVVLYNSGDESAWEYPRQVGQKLGWDEKQFQLREIK